MAERDDLARVEYTPTDDEIQRLFVENLPGASDDWAGAHALWGRWLAEHDRAVRAEQRERDAQIAGKFYNAPGGGISLDIAAAIHIEGTDR